MNRMGRIPHIIHHQKHPPIGQQRPQIPRSRLHRIRTKSIPRLVQNPNQIPQTTQQIRILPQRHPQNPILKPPLHIPIQHDCRRQHRLPQSPQPRDRTHHQSPIVLRQKLPLHRLQRPRPRHKIIRQPHPRQRRPRFQTSSARSIR